MAEELGEVAIARLRGRSLKGAAERGGNAGVGRRNVHSDDPAVHIQFRRLKLFAFCNHMRETMPGGLSFVRFDKRTAESDR